MGLLSLQVRIGAKRNEVWYYLEQYHARLEHKDPCIKPFCSTYQALERTRNKNMAMDMKDPAIVERHIFLWNKKKTEMSIQSMTPDQALEHIKSLESALEVLVFESRSEIQGARDYLEDQLKLENTIKIKEIREKDKAIKYRPSLVEREQKEKAVKRESTKSVKANLIQELEAEGLSKKLADMVAGFMSLGMSKEAAKKMAGIKDV